ncbi:helix-turn-helix transcriptional regulator [Haloechinothrix sp. YIM 98757]|uniref:Helix-turn-helix transcriptional regulator n=1 Tax=Haloechinothrix aidingensis TaxID=2752311 RepID=A0A837ZZ18_9PSEU|nr:PadR family transcriptional regulator [Haloechinothrix aidingensis]MBA0125474.1 helix-turn-helix transcriptional regulator [Haloechinothrix aidingensis]
MSATRLLVLGVVRMYGTAHGYQVRRELHTWSADRWANAQPGSIYHALKKMAAEGLLEPVESGPGKAGPERTTYRLTTDGQTDYQVLLARALTEVSNDPQNAYAFCAALALLPTLPRERAVNLLSQRVNELRAARSNCALTMESAGNWGEPEHVAEMYRLWFTQLDATIGWATDLIDRLESGQYTMADDSSRAFGAPGSA